MRRYNSCDGSPITAVCAALSGVIGFFTSESYRVYCNGVGDDYLTMTWIGAASLVAVVGFAFLNGMRYGF